MRDPWEGKAPDGTITTGADRDRISPDFAPVLAAAVAAVVRAAPSASVAVYGSVATGQARPPSSDVDLIAVGLPSPTAQQISAELTTRFRHVCREVAITSYPVANLTAAPADSGELTDAAYGDRVFLRHYCVLLSGVDHARAWPPFPADARAARGFNGDIAIHAARWRSRLDSEPPADLGRRLARKTLLAVSGLVSVHDDTWTTDRAAAVRRWSELRPDQSAALARLLEWSDGRSGPSRADVRQALDGVVPHVVTAFANLIGRWTS